MASFSIVSRPEVAMSQSDGTSLRVQQGVERFQPRSGRVPLPAFSDLNRSGLLNAQNAFVELVEAFCLIHEVTLPATFLAAVPEMVKASVLAYRSGCR